MMNNGFPIIVLIVFIICSFMHHGVFLLQGFIFVCMIYAVYHINTVNKKMPVLTPVAGLSLEMLRKGPSTLNSRKPGVPCSFHILDEIKLHSCTDETVSPDAVGKSLNYICTKHQITLERKVPVALTKTVGAW